MLKTQNRNIYISLNDYKRVELSELLYFISYSLYVFKMILSTTMLSKFLNNKISTLMDLLVIILLLVKIILLSKYSFKNIFVMSIIGISSLVVYSKTSYITVLFLALFIIGANKVSFMKISKIFISIKVSVLFIAMIAANIGLIEHIIYVRNGIKRYSFGSIYPTDFAAGVFFIILVYIFLKKDSLKFIDSIVFFFIGVGTFYFCNARLDSICIFITAIISLFWIKTKKSYKKNISLIFKCILISIIPICSIISIWISFIYNSSNKFLYNLNMLLSNRLELGRIGINEYGLTLFGQKVDMIGNGGSNVQPTNYFFIDSSYLYIGLRYGIVILIIFCLLFSIYVKKNLEKGEIIIPIIIALIAVNSIVAHRLIDIAYNPFVLAFFANCNVQIKKKKIILKR